MFLKRRRLLDYDLFEQQAINNNMTYEFITSIQEIKLQGCEQRRRWKWENIQTDLFDLQMKSLKLQQVQEAGGLFINEIKNVIIVIVSATSVIHNEMTLGMMLAVQYIIGQLNSPVEQLMLFIYSLQDVRISVERINEIHRLDDENGKHVRTKKEILGEDGESREGCSIVKKGEVYEKKLFTAKEERFKSNSFLDEVKHSYTDLINIYVQDESQKLQVFERGSVYLATKKIGKNNPKAQEIEADNQKRREWNRAVDMALISGVPEPKIMEVKRKEITEPIRESIARRGNRPRLFSRVVTVAVEALEFLIASVLFKKPREVPEQTSVAQTERTEAEHQEHIAENSMAAVKVTKDEKSEPEQPKMTRLASKYSKLFKVNKELEEQNSAIQKKQKQLSAKKKELSEVKGWFKGRKKKELQNEIDELKSQIRDMKDYLPRIVQKIGYRSVQEFLKDFKASQIEYSQYRTAIEKWKKETGKDPVAHGIRAKLAEKKQEIQNEQKNKQHTRSQNKDRGVR